jgi:phage protein D
MDNRIRRVYPDIILDDTNISINLRPYIQSIEVTDNLEGTLDDMKLNLINKENKFLSKDWGFEKKQKLTYNIKTLNWENANEGLIQAASGIFFIDEKEFDKELAIIKAISAPLEAKDTKSSKTWGKITLKNLGKEKADKYNLEFQYLVNEEINLADLKQEKQSDFEFLNKIAEDEGVKLKITFNKLILFMEDDFIKKNPVAVIDLNNVKDYKLIDKSSNIFDSVEVTYFNTNKYKKEKILLTESELRGGKKGESEKPLKINARSKSGDLKKFALKKLEQANKKEIKLNIPIVGDRRLYAGCTITIINSGEYNGKYMVYRVVKTLPEFTTNIETYKIKEDENNDDNIKK